MTKSIPDNEPRAPIDTSRCVNDAVEIAEAPAIAIAIESWLEDFRKQLSAASTAEREALLISRDGRIFLSHTNREDERTEGARVARAAWKRALNERRAQPGHDDADTVRRTLYRQFGQLVGVPEHIRRSRELAEFFDGIACDFESDFLHDEDAAHREPLDPAERRVTSRKFVTEVQKLYQKHFGSHGTWEHRSGRDFPTLEKRDQQRWLAAIAGWLDFHKSNGRSPDFENDTEDDLLINELPFDIDDFDPVDLKRVLSTWAARGAPGRPSKDAEDEGKKWKPLVDVLTKVWGYCGDADSLKRAVRNSDNRSQDSDR